MTSGFLKKKYNRLYISMLMSWTVCLVGSLSDSILGGIFISEDAVSATGLVQPIFALVIFVANLLAIGCSSKFSNYAGAFDKENASKVAGIGVVLALAAGIGIGILAFLCEDLFFLLYPVGPAVETMAREYYRCMVVLMMIYPIYYVMYYLVMIDGDDTRMVCADITSAIGNAAFSLILVQKWGVKGLACGTIFSTILASGFIAWHFFSKVNSVCFKFKLEPKLLKEIAVSGSTMSLTTLYIAIIDIFMNKFIIDHFGDAYLAAYAVVNLILNMGQISICAADAASAFVGVSYGEKNPKALRAVLVMCTKRTLMTTAGMTVLFLVIAPYVPAIYGITTPEIVEASVYITRVLALSYVVTGFVYEWIGYLPKIDKSMLGNLIGMVYMLAAPLVFPVAFAAIWGFKGMVWGFFATPFAAFAVASAYIILVYGKEAYPYAIPENDSTIFIHEFAFTNQEIMLLCSTLRDEMASIGLSSSLMTKVELILEETLMIVEEKNPGRKQLLGDCTLIVTDKTVNLITRDNGILFDIIEETDKGSSLRHYVASRFISGSEAAYLTTISFNRNSFLWRR